MSIAHTPVPVPASRMRCRFGCSFRGAAYIFEPRVIINKWCCKSVQRERQPSQPYGVVGV